MSRKLLINYVVMQVLEHYLDNYRKRLHGRGLASALKMNQKTVALALAALYELRILDYSQRGRNKEYYLRFDNELTRYYLVFAETYKTATLLANNFELKALVSQLKSNNCIDGIAVIFGSFASDTFTKDSDVDLLVIGKINWTGVKKVKATLARELNAKTVTKQQFELALMKKDALAMEILKNHVVAEGIDAFVSLLWRQFNE